jgi:Arc/MetJ-type ribon-helix-helix transcriptional regulator
MVKSYRVSFDGFLWIWFYVIGVIGGIRGKLISLYAYVLHMVTKIVPVRLREEELRQIDRLVKYGIFQSRSEAIRELIRLGVESLAYLSEVLEAVERLFELERVEGRIPIDLSGATEQLLRERER